MTQQTDGNDQAFATPPIYSDAFGLAVQEKGLSKREYFAAMAMQALVTRGVHSIKENAADQSVLYADALIEALIKRNNMTEETLMFIAKYFVGFVFGYVLGRAIFKKK